MQNNLAGKAIRLCRKLRGLTQKDLGILASLSVAHISLVESGKRDILLSTFLNVCEKLEIPPFLALFGAENEAKSSELSEKMSFLWLEYARGAK